jgi:hypothetical protein
MPVHPVVGWLTRRATCRATAALREVGNADVKVVVMAREKADVKVVVKVGVPTGGVSSRGAMVAASGVDAAAVASRGSPASRGRAASSTRARLPRW